MTQAFLGQIADTNFESGDALAARLNAFDIARKSNQAGTSRPPGIAPGGVWSRDNEDGTFSLMLFDGSKDLEYAQASSEATLAPGDIVIWPKAVPRQGTLECDGAAVSRANYSDLFDAIGTTFGAGDGTTTFNLPDFRGEFLRGWDHGAGHDPDAAARTDRGDGTGGDVVGSKQADENKNHSHGYVDSTPNGSGTGASGLIGFVLRGNTNRTTDDSGGSEARPRNVAMMFCIKY